MGLRTSESVVVPASRDDVFAIVADLGSYPLWLGLVHRADPVADDPPAWTIELRARIGPFARSKQLRMERADLVPATSVEFARAEIDGKQHARWELRVELDDDPLTAPQGTVVTMHLSYDGALWTGGVLERALDDEVRRGREGLIRLVSAEPTR